MLAEKLENISEERKTCEYKGVTYFVMTDIQTKKCFIEVNGKKMFLDCNGVVANKQRGTNTPCIFLRLVPFSEQKNVGYITKNYDR